MYLTAGLPKGNYCNIIDDCGTWIEVGSNGMARVVISGNDINADPILAVCVGCGVRDGPSKATSLSLNVLTLLAILSVTQIF